MTGPGQDWAYDDDAYGDDAYGDDAYGDDARRRGSGSAGGSRSNRGTRLLVLLVLLGLLAGGIALEQREPDVTVVRATPSGLAGPAIPPGDAVSTAWYCAAGAAVAEGPGAETVYVGNLSDRTITADVTVDVADAPPTTERLRIEPYGRGALVVADVVEAESPGVVVEVAGGPAIVEHEIRDDADVAMSPCAREPSVAWYFAAGGTPRGATQVLELFNPFGDDAILDITFVTDAGVQEPQALQGFVVGRRTKVRVPVTDLVPRQERVATVVRTRTGRVIAEQVRTFDGAEGVTGLTLASGATVPRRQWTLPVAAARSGEVGTVAIANFDVVPTSVEVSVLLSGSGVLDTETVDVPSRSVVRFDPSVRVPADTAYTVVVRALRDVPVVAESSLDTADGAATSGGSALTARRWALAGAPDDASSAVVAANRGSVPLTVELRAFTAGDAVGPRSAPAIAVPPGKTARFDLDEWGIDPDQVLVVSADGPIVVGRETYAGGVSLALAVPFLD